MTDTYPKEANIPYWGDHRFPLVCNAHFEFMALKNLREDNVIYLYRSDIEGYWKIGLKTNFLKILESEGEKRGSVQLE